MYEEDFTKIINASNDNSLYFFVGAGVSAISGTPDWKNLINVISEKINRPLKDEYTNDDYLRIPQMYYHSLDNKDDYFRTIESEINIAGLEPNSIHYEMLNLNPASFITTNYDTLLEDSAENYCQFFKAISSDKELPSISGDRFILKIHGDFKNKNIVLKEEDYLCYSEKFKLIDTLLKSIFSTKTVVFIGYSFNDYDIMQVLSWVKDLLQDDFKKPIFFYCGNDKLPPEDLIYQESKGIKVLEWQKLLDKEDANYEERYAAFFNAIRKHKEQDYSIKDIEEAFYKLFRLFEPLDSLRTIRYVDISKKISNYDCIIESNGIIRTWNNNVLFNKYVEIDKMDLSDRKELSEESLKMYKTISSVLNKARIFGVHLSNEIYFFKNTDDVFADSHCIFYDYKWMNEYAKKDYKQLDKLYFKAYYLYRLFRYDEALHLFAEVARKAFKKKRYLIFYFAKSNCIRISRLLENPWFSYSKSGKEDDLLNSNLKENLFNNLPIDFKEDYASLKDILDSKLLFEYAYNAFESAYKVQEIIDTNTIEYGLTACDKAMSRINDFLHFMVGNGLAIDFFDEYKNPVKRIMEALVYHYANQDKHEVRFEHIFPERRTAIKFDEIDFYCFIECFKDKEILRVLDKNSVSYLSFQNIGDIEKVIRNIFDYYTFAIKEKSNFAEVYSLQIKIKKILILSRYMELSQDLVDYMTRFILENEFRDILINDKVMFLDRQIYKHNMQSRKTINAIEKRLFMYIDEHKKALESEKKYEMLSGQVGITYMNLANYLMKNGNEYVSRGLSERVSIMIEKNQLQLFSGHYYNHINLGLQKKVIKWLEKSLEDDFSFKRLCFLVSQNYQLSRKVTDQLIIYLENEKKSDCLENSVHRVPTPKKFNSIIQVGYWCFLGLINPNDYNEFLGTCDEFDFYYNPEIFSYEKFDVSWLFGMRKNALIKLASNEKTKISIRNCITKSVQANDFSRKDNYDLSKILIEYFC